MIFWRKIVIFHTKDPKNVRASLRSAQIRAPGAPPHWIRPCKCHIFICVECVSVFMNYKVSGVGI
jgi:hypothetical protein